VAGDDGAAFAWLENELPPAEREAGFRQLAAGLAGSAPDLLAANFDRLPDSVRPEARRRLLQVWRQTEPAKAKAWEAEHPDE
jgi:hypothetical protein